MNLTCVSWDYDPKVSITDEVRAAHMDYLNELVVHGSLLAAGPRADAPGGVLLFNATPNEVGPLLAADPFAAIPLITATTVTPFAVAVGGVGA